MSFINALLWWPVITYAVGIILLFVPLCMTYWQTERMKIRHLIYALLTWPWQARRLFE